MKRVMRMKGTGISLLTTKPNIANVVKYTKERRKTFYTPHESDIFEHIVQNIAEVSNVPLTSITQDPQKCIALLYTDVSSAQPTRMTSKYGTSRVDESFVLDIPKFDDFSGLQFQNKYVRGVRHFNIMYPGLNEILLELGPGNIHTKTMAPYGDITVGFHHNDDEIHNLTKDFINNIIVMFKKIHNVPNFVIINTSVLSITPKTKIIQNGKRLSQSQIMFKNKVEQVLISIPYIVHVRRHNMGILMLEAKEIRL